LRKYKKLIFKAAAELVCLPRGKLMDKDSFVISQEAEMIAEERERQFGDDPDFQD
jgi:hypothetical protein